MEPAPPRIQILLARNAPKAVILRRGPSKWTQMISWDLRDDTLVEGQWFKGRIYENYCDLSPDGKYMLYFGAKHHLSYDNNGYKNTFTAVSKPPYFTALALWPIGHTWYGGGYFTEAGQLMLNFSDWYTPHPEHLPHEKLKVTHMEDRTYYSESVLYALRNEGGGWTRLKQEGYPFETQEAEVKGEVTPWGKANGKFLLVRWVRDYLTTPKVLGHALYKQEKGKVKAVEIWDKVEFPDQEALPDREELPDQAAMLSQVDFADWDERGRVILAAAGCLYASNLNLGVEEFRKILDLNDRTPVSVAPARAAREW